MNGCPRESAPFSGSVFSVPLWPIGVLPGAQGPLLHFTFHPIHSIALKFTIDKISDLWNHLVCCLEETSSSPRFAPSLTPSGRLQTPPASPLESTLAKVYQNKAL